MAEVEGEAGSIGLALAFVYGAGLAANNLFLAHFGLSDFSIIKPKAIFTGAIVLGSLAVLCAAPMHFISRYMDSRAPGWTYGPQVTPRSIFLKLALPFLVVVTLFAVATMTRSPLAEQLPLRASTGAVVGSVFLKSVAFFVSSCAAAICSIQALLALRQLRSSGNFQGVASRLARTSLFLTGALVSLAIYMSLFVTTLYTFIPGSIGGPGLEPVQFEVTQDAAVAEWKELGLAFEYAGSRITKPVRVLLETEDTAVIMIPRESVEADVHAAGAKGSAGDMTRVLRIDRKMLEHSIILGEK